MKIRIISAFLFGLLGACSAPETSPAATEGGVFRTTQPSHLYFKNIRSSSYLQETKAGTRIDLYRLRGLADTKERPLLYPIIVDNWMEDEAYLLLEPNDFIQGFSDTLRVHWRSERDSGRYELARRDWQQQYLFAQQLYEGVQAGYGFRIQTAGGEYVPFLEANQDRQSFRTTLRDYNKLTERH